MAIWKSRLFLHQPNLTPTTTTTAPTSSTPVFFRVFDFVVYRQPNTPFVWLSTLLALWLSKWQRAVLKHLIEPKREDPLYLSTAPPCSHPTSTKICICSEARKRDLKFRDFLRLFGTEIWSSRASLHLEGESQIFRIGTSYDSVTISQILSV